MSTATENQHKSRKIRVLQLGSPSGLYGAERWILALVNHLDSDQVESWIASIRDDPALKPSLGSGEGGKGLNRYVFDCPGILNFSAIPHLRKFIRKHSIDIIHTHGYKTDLIGILAVKGSGCKIVATPHGWTSNPDFKLACYELLDRFAFLFVDAVVPLSDELFRQLRIIPGLKRKLHLIRNGVDVDEVDRVVETAAEIRRWKGEGEFVVGYIGRLTSGKGLKVLLQAVAESGQRHWKVAIVGEGEQESELRNLAQALNLRERVAFYGYRQDRLSFLKAFDLFVIPSKSEGISRSIMEAMIAGVPVVASDIPGCRQIIEPGRTGLLVPVDEPTQLAHAIKKMAEDPEFSHAVANNARQFILSHFSARRMGQEYLRLFSALVSF